MKKARLWLKFFVLSFFFVCTIIFCNFNLITTTKILHSTDMLAINSQDSYQEFLATITQMTRQHSISENALVFLDKEKDLFSTEDGTYYVAEQTFTDLTQTDSLPLSVKTKAVKLRSCAEPVYSVEEIAKLTNYNITDSQHSIVLTRRFATKRVILESLNPNFDKCGAVAVASFKNMYVLQYDTTENALAAYNYYQSCQGISNVGTDGLCWIEKDIQPKDSNSGEDLWDIGNIMGVTKYSKYLSDTLKANNNQFSKLPEVVVAVLDTGIDTDHSWFKNRLLVGDDGKYIGMDYTGINSTGYSFEDDNGHGTHCAGIICNMTPSNVKILPIKFLCANEDKNKEGSGLALYNALNYIFEMSKKHNIVAVNMSFGMECSDETKNFNQYLESKFEEFYNRGMFCVVAAGNNYRQDTANYFPSNIKKAITVSALDPDLKLAEYSNIGEMIDVCAPGTNVNSAYFDGNTVVKTGTSMAAPHVAGYLALLKTDPTHNYTMAEIEQILSGEYQDKTTILDLGSPGKDIDYGYGLPILDGLVPEYVTVDIQAGLHGQTSPSGFNLYAKDEPITIKFIPDERYFVSAVYVDENEILNLNKVTEYTFNELSGHHDIKVKFNTDEIPYVVNHYWEPIYDLHNPDSVPDLYNYELHESETLYTRQGFFSEAEAKNYLGFNVVAFEQKIITEPTSLNIYYKRNKYNLLIEQTEQGFEGISGAGEYLFGDTVTIIPKMQKEYDFYTWEISGYDDQEFLANFAYNLPSQTFIMPASNLVLKAYPILKTYLITIKQIGKGTVTPNGKCVNYGDDIKFEITPNENYVLKSIYCNGVEQVITENTFQLFDVTADMEITVYFERITPEINKDWVDFAIWGSGGTFALCLFGVSVLLLFMAFKRRA